MGSERRDIRGGVLGIHTEYLKRCLREAKHEKDQVGRRWELVVRLVQLEFWDGTVPEEIAWAKMVLLPKGKGGYWGIRIVEIL